MSVISLNMQYSESHTPKKTRAKANTINHVYSALESDTAAKSYASCSEASSKCSQVQKFASVEDGN